MICLILKLTCYSFFNPFSSFLKGLDSTVIQILLYPCAKVLEWLLPDWGITVFGVRHSLNPGPWTFKEQMFATITYNIAIYTTNAYGMVSFFFPSPSPPRGKKKKGMPCVLKRS